MPWVSHTSFQKPSAPFGSAQLRRHLGSGVAVSLNAPGHDVDGLLARVNGGIEPDSLHPSRTFDPAARARVKRDADALMEQFARHFAPVAEIAVEPEPERKAA